MSNWVACKIDVLAKHPAQMTRIARRLKQASPKLLAQIAGDSGERVSDVREVMKRILDFKKAANPGYQDGSAYKAQRFHASFENRCFGVVRNHIADVSEGFLGAVFLLEYRDDMLSYSGKEVFHAGDVVRYIHDGDHKVQAVDWVLPDIFAPFLAEYFADLPFGSLWEQWVKDLRSAADKFSGFLNQ